MICVCAQPCKCNHVVVQSARNTCITAVSLYCMWIFRKFFFWFFRFPFFFFRSLAIDNISLALLYGNPTLKVGRKAFKLQAVGQVIYKLFKGTSNIPSGFFTSYNCMLLLITSFYIESSREKERELR